MPKAQILLDNRYAILHIERTKNFSKVFYALDTYQNPARNCVIKAFKPIVRNSQIARWIHQEFCQEADRLKRISSIERHIPQIYTYFNDSQTYYLVQELVEGKTLKEKVQQENFSPQEVRDILVKLLSVLEHLHQEGVIHQNIQPKNIILRREDRAPMLINFGTIRRIVATVDLYGNKQILSLKDPHNYIPSEQALGRAIPASDLYSLGLTAIYLLTGKNPTDLSIDLNSNTFKIPSEIKNLDSNLYAVIARSISLNTGDRYNSAREMLDALSHTTTKNFLDNKKLARRGDSSTNLGFAKHTEYIAGKNHKINFFNSSNLWAMLLLITGICLVGSGWIVWYDWNSTQNAVIPPLPEPSTALPSILSDLSEQNRENFLIFNSESVNLVEIPIFTTGTQKEQLRDILGEPNAIQKGYWANSSAWIYQERAKGAINLGYLFDLETDRLRQTEVAVVPAVGLSTIQEILDSLLKGNSTRAIDRELQKIYAGQADTYLFRVGELEGNIQRDENNNIYLGVWEADFH